MPNIPPTSSIKIQPNHGLGPLSLSASLYSTLATLLHHKSTFPRLNISFNSSNPVINPIYIDLESNGLRLRFDGESQLLELIEVIEFGKIGLLYGDTYLWYFISFDVAYSSRNTPPSFRSIYRIFGPTSPGELLPATSSSPYMYILSYPGIAFKFPVPSNAPTSPSDRDLLNLLHKTDPPCLATSLVIFSGGSWNEVRKTLNQSRPCIVKTRGKKLERGNDEDDHLGFAEIFPNDKIELHFESGSTVSLNYGTFTAQDAITLLGPPNEVYTKSDTRLNIHNNRHHDDIDTGPLSEGIISLEGGVLTIAPEYFFNYFSMGLSLLFSPARNHTLQKILLHANLPQSHAFHCFNRIRWILAIAKPTRKHDATKEIITSESNFEEIKYLLEGNSGPTGNPMIVNRGGQGSPSSSIELVSDDILTASPFGCTGISPLNSFY